MAYVRPKVRAKRVPEARRQTQAAENVPRPARPGLGPAAGALVEREVRPHEV